MPMARPGLTCGPANVVCSEPRHDEQCIHEEQSKHKEQCTHEE